ncbi:tRNA (guanine(46)-N(7))-methyltransferase TrmB [Jiella sp. MQZ9-1]|uniref:tRNA (guanine-N(7)-)-methyltransferase n=1 Tax=Jiella flava TaxID=2816857 RepID=A0A939FXT3_9HYPH|nr:tRNA (guanine(46)-N(7))-methyltransferase TrmB [Jiella flava]MBO0661364.1 tRNA (guanosine(46)-N7)-methyltransferase TrmB [Jiella flava]MCD2470009.1 tRNA (guanine(46)-N(7))-methyltransferase TrmB [Jiella flava]
MVADGHPERRREAFFGRLKGPKLRQHQAALIANRLPALRLDLTMPPPAALSALYASPKERFRLEIGFGGGEHLLHRSGEDLACGFIGVEPFVNGMAKLLSALEAAPRDNLRLFDDDAALLLDWLPAASLDAVDLLYPDPWPKKRHFKRRFVNTKNLDRIARVLKPGGYFRFASDIDTYVNWTLRHVGDHSAFIWTAARPADWQTPFAGWPGTRYEAKAIREGRPPAYLTFQRV